MTSQPMIHYMSDTPNCTPPKRKRKDSSIRVRRLWEVAPGDSAPEGGPAHGGPTTKPIAPRRPPPAAPRSPVDRTPQEIAAEELSRSCSPRRAARKAGVDLAVIRQWMQDPEFADMVLEIRTTWSASTCAIVSRSGPAAARILAAEMQGTAGKCSARRIRAAKVILEFHMKAMESLELAQRLRDLERALTERGNITPLVLEQHVPIPSPLAPVDTSVVEQGVQGSVPSDTG